MKITIEPTTDQSNIDSRGRYRTVSIADPSDELDLTEAIELCALALEAWGFVDIVDRLEIVDDDSDGVDDE